MKNTTYIKNMVCPRCLTTVKDIFNKLEIEYNNVQLGEVTTPNELGKNQKISLEKNLIVNGFELLKDNNSQLISQIKSIIIDQIHYTSESLKVNFSTFIAQKLNHEYSALSKLFSSVEGITIERFVLKQKIEKVKELIFYDQMSLSEIANIMNYSSTAHLSSQFKKETGMSPTGFKNLRKPSHQPLDSI